MEDAGWHRHILRKRWITSDRAEHEYGQGWSYHPLHKLQMMSFTDLISIINKINNKSLKFMIPVGIAALIFFPIIDRVFFYQQRINFKLETLTRLNNIKQDELDSAIEIELYHSTIRDIENYISVKQYNLNLIENIRNNIWKFLTGILFWTIIFILLIFSREFKFFSKLGSLILTAIIGMFFGVIGTYIPDIFNPIVNYILYPILQILFILSLFNIPVLKYIGNKK